MRILLTVALTLVPAAASAATNCRTIADPDQRAYCRAVATNSAGQCSAISDYALRQTCRARLGGGDAACNS
ncbi:MAG: hypothetical protein HY899_08255, partial [Deltaproteobacteria bacterium]|nr:hypothetical protein [Deltaproteobacteria bacterium]